MTIPDGPNPSSDPLWDELGAIDRKKEQETEEGYKTIEGYNAHLLNQVAGITNMELTLERKLGDESDASGDTPPERLSLPTRSLNLYLRPDTKGALYEQGETADLAYAGGDPITVYGEVPERTEKLIADLFAGTSAQFDEESSTPDEEVWYGDVAGQMIKFVLIHGVMNSYGLDVHGKQTIKSTPTLALRAYREDTSTGEANPS